MSTDRSLFELRQELDRLGQVRKRLVDELNLASDQLISPGQPPSEELVDSLLSYRSRMVWLTNRLTGGVANSPGSHGESVSLSELGDAINRYEQKAEALKFLDLVFPLKHVEIADFAPLALCQAEARRLKEAVAMAAPSDADQELESVRLGNHPLNSLLALCDRADQLTDSEWSAHNDLVTEAYGRQMATALARGRIQRPFAQQSVSQAQASVEPTRVVKTEAIGDESQSSLDSALFRRGLSPAEYIRSSLNQQPLSAQIPGSSMVSPQDFKEVVKPIPYQAASSAPGHMNVFRPESNVRPNAALDVFGADSLVPPPLPSRASHVDAETFVNAPRISGLPKPALPEPVKTSSHPLPAPMEPEIPPDLIFDGPPLVGTVFDIPQTPKKLPSVEAKRVGGSSRLKMSPLMARNSNPSSGTGRSVESADVRETTLLSAIVPLLSQGRYALAAHVARCLELRPAATPPFPPSWLIRSIILGRALSYATGEIARQLDTELRSIRTELLSEGDDERRLAMGLLTRAAALPASLLTGSNVSTTVLRSFRIEPGLSQLYNYCSRIALYGDRLNGQVVEMFRPKNGQIADGQEELLSEKAAEWLQSAADRAAIYERTSPLFLHAHWTLTAATSIRHAEATHHWCKWQETLLLAARLLNPVIHNLTSERNQVKQEIARLNSSVRVEAVEVTQRQAASGAPVRGIVLPIEEMRQVIQEAIDFANQWLRVSSMNAPSGATPISQDSVELKEEVLNRTAGVIAELGDLWRVNSSGLVRCAVAACRESVVQIRDLFVGEQSLAWNEPSLSHVLNAELLKIPGLELDEQWLPGVEPATLECELVSHLERGDIDWQQAFQLQSLNGDHAATGRILELNVWPDEKTRDSLQEQRQGQLNASRAAVEHELHELNIYLESLVSSGVLETNDGDLFAQRIERLRLDLPEMQRFGACLWQLDQLRSSLQRRSGVTNLKPPTVGSREAAVRPVPANDSIFGNSQLPVRTSEPSLNSVDRRVERDVIPPKGIELEEASSDDHVVFATDIFSGE